MPNINKHAKQRFAVYWVCQKMPKSVSASAFLLFCYSPLHIIQRAALQSSCDCLALLSDTSAISAGNTLQFPKPSCEAAVTATGSVALIPSRAKPTIEKAEVCTLVPCMYSWKWWPIEQPEWFFSELGSPASWCRLLKTSDKPQRTIDIPWSLFLIVHFYCFSSFSFFLIDTKRGQEKKEDKICLLPHPLGGRYTLSRTGWNLKKSFYHSSLEKTFVISCALALWAHMVRAWVWAFLDKASIYWNIKISEVNPCRKNISFVTDFFEIQDKIFHQKLKENVTPYPSLPVSPSILGGEVWV